MWGHLWGHLWEFVKGLEQLNQSFMFIYKSFYPLLMGYIRKKNIKEITYNIVGRISILWVFPYLTTKVYSENQAF